MAQPTIKQKWMLWGFCLAIFLAMFLFFFSAHPLILLSLDDWAYFSGSRIALPSPTFWNPSRVLPETLMPIVGTLTGILYSLGFSDYCRVQSFTVAVVYSLFITIYVLAFLRLVRRKFSLSLPVAILAATGFFLLHFLIFRSLESRNLHMFYTEDVVCIFFYVIPALLSSTLVMLDMTEDLLADFFSREHLLKKAFLLLTLYLAMFSNLFGSGILAIYLGFKLLGKLISYIREKRAAAFWKGELADILLLLLWIIAALCEALGGRASVSFGDQRPLPESIGEALQWLGKLFGRMNLLMIATFVLSVILLLVVFLRRSRGTEAEKNIRSLLAITLASGLLCTIFLVLLSAVVCPGYLTKPEVAFGTFFYLLLIPGLLLGYLLKRYERLTLLLPLLLLVLFSFTNTKEKTFEEHNCLGVSAQKIMEINRDLIAQLREADAAGETEVALQTIDTEITGDNWPHTLPLGKALSDILWKHGVITRPLTIKIVPSVEFNNSLGLVSDELRLTR